MNANQYRQLYDEVVADLAKLEAEVSQLQAVRKYLETKGEKGDGVAVANHAKTPSSQSDRFAAMKQIGAARIVLQEAKGPLKTREIAKRLIEGGFGADDMARLKTSLFTTMTRKPEVFSKAGAGLWKLKEAET